MVMSKLTDEFKQKKKLTYEECRLERLAENKKRMEALNLPQLAQSLHKTALLPKSPPMKQVKPRTFETEMVAVRRSSRVANLPAQVYIEVKVASERARIPKRFCGGRTHDLANRVYASDKARYKAIERADEVLAGLESGAPSFVKSMLQSHISGGFWLGLPADFCRKSLPRRDDVIMTLVDEEGEEYQVIYLDRKHGLSGGWMGFAIAHKLADGDALVFELIRSTTFKVHITRVKDFEDENKV